MVSNRGGGDRQRNCGTEESAWGTQGDERGVISDVKSKKSNKNGGEREKILKEKSVASKANGGVFPAS